MPYFADKRNHMDDQMKFYAVSKIKHELNDIPKASRQELLWSLLAEEITGNRKAVGWLLEQVGIFIEDEGKKILGPFQ